MQVTAVRAVVVTNTHISSLATPKKVMIAMINDYGVNPDRIDRIKVASHFQKFEKKLKSNKIRIPAEAAAKLNLPLQQPAAVVKPTVVA
jgi:hypothetical protein